MPHLWDAVIFAPDNEFRSTFVGRAINKVEIIRLGYKRINVIVRARFIADCLYRIAKVFQQLWKYLLAVYGGRQYALDVLHNERFRPYPLEYLQILFIQKMTIIVFSLVTRDTGIA